MEYRKAQLDDLGSVFSITQAVIRDIYPYFYPTAAVQWFAAQHDCERILADISAGRVRLFEAYGKPVGTITIDGNRLLRVFVAPDQQRKGYGDRLIRFAEKEVAQAHEKVVLDSSLPAGRFFQAHGYRTRSHEVYDIEDGHGMLTAILAWETMEKPLRDAAASDGAQAPAPASGAAPASEAASSKAAVAQKGAKAPAEAQAAASEAEPAAPAEAPAQAVPSAAEEALAMPAADPAPASPSSEGTTITISSDTASVMRQLPQMPF